MLDLKVLNRKIIFRVIGGGYKIDQLSVKVVFNRKNKRKYIVKKRRKNNLM